MLLDLFDRVTRDHVADLVRDDARQHVGLVGLRDQSRIDVDVATGKTERVHRRIVDDLEIERTIRERRDGVDSLADHPQIGRRLRIVDQSNLLLDLRRGLIS